MLVQRYRQRQKFYETMLATVDTSNPAHNKFYEECLNHYKEAMFPYIRKQADDYSRKAREVLEKAFTGGPLVIRDGVLQSK